MIGKGGGISVVILLPRKGKCAKARNNQLMLPFVIKKVSRPIVQTSNPLWNLRGTWKFIVSPGNAFTADTGVLSSPKNDSPFHSVGIHHPARGPKFHRSHLPHPSPPWFTLSSWVKKVHKKHGWIPTTVPTWAISTPKIIIIWTNFTKSSTPRCTWSSKFYIAALHPLHPAGTPLFFSSLSDRTSARCTAGSAARPRRGSGCCPWRWSRWGRNDAPARLGADVHLGMVGMVGKFIWDLSEIHDVEKMMLEIGGKSFVNCMELERNSWKPGGLEGEMRCRISS